METNPALAPHVSLSTWATRLRLVVAAPLLLWLLLAMPAVVQAQFTYTTANNQITITGYTGAISALIIPDTINGLPVTSIGDGAFAGTALTKLTIPESVAAIGDNAFENCTGLTSITIPNSVTRIGGYAFDACTSLTSVTIPKGVTSIGIQAFGACTGLTNISVDVSNPAYSSLSGVLFDKEQATLIQFPAGQGGTYTIPNGVTNIGDIAFIGCSSLTRVTIPNSVITIGDHAFASCHRLTSITIPKSAISIGTSAFIFCRDLVNVTIPNSVTTLGSKAFAYCSGLKEIYFHGNAPSVGSRAFLQADNAIVYYLPETTGWGATFADRTTVLWNSLIQTADAGFGVKAGQFGFNVTGTSGLSFVVEAATDLAQPAWAPVSTNTLVAGTAAFSDPQWQSYPSRLYRLRTP